MDFLKKLTVLWTQTCIALNGVTFFTSKFTDSRKYAKTFQEFKILILVNLSSFTEIEQRIM